MRQRPGDSRLASSRQTLTMERDLALEHIERDATRILELATKMATLPAHEQRIPSCPDWTLADLANHLGRVYAMVTVALQGDPDEVLDRRTIPERPAEQSPADWLHDRLDVLLGLLRARTEDDRAWNFAEGTGAPVGFWWRRQAHETLIHRVDAELAAGAEVEPVDPAFAADGIGDFLLIGGHKQVSWEDLQLGDDLSVHLHATDTSDAEWTIDTGNRVYATAHLKADVAVRGPAWALDLWLWRRGSAGSTSDTGMPGLDLETFGDVAAAEAWRPTL